ncbi:MAG: helix-turn-helix domain-containing protein [Candidatus Tectimicrobiota bacterium]
MKKEIQLSSLELHTLRPQSVTLSSHTLGWHGISVWGRQSPPTAITLPPLTKHQVLIQFNAGPRLLQERDGHSTIGPWRKGDILIVRAGQPTAWHAEGPIDNLHIDLEADFLDQVALESCDMNPDYVELLDVLHGRDREIVRIGNALLRELRTPGPGGPLYAESLGNLLALHLLRTYSTRVPVLRYYQGGLPKPQLQRILDYINAHLEQQITLAELAGLAQVSARHFLRMFKQSTGLAPHQYVLERRLLRAQELLRFSQLPLADIAFRVGFRTQSHFTQSFRRATGLTPRAYRASLTTTRPRIA